MIFLQNNYNLLVHAYAGRTQTGLARAKAERKVLGRPTKTTQEQRKAMIEAYKHKTSVSALAWMYGISRAGVLTVVKSSPVRK